MKIYLTIRLDSDFHVGSGEGFGRTIDSVVVRNDFGAPSIPASSLKGLTRWHATQLIELAPFQRLFPEPARAEVIDCLFGEMGRRRGQVWFEDATPVDHQRFIRPRVHGRNARDRKAGRARDKALFHYEDAAAAEYRATLTCQPPSSDAHKSAWEARMLLLLAALRRIEAIGGQRRRGKGRAQVAIQTVDAPPPFDGLILPEPDAKFASLLRQKLAAETAHGTQDDAESSRPTADADQPALPHSSQDATDQNTDAGQLGRCLLLLAYARQPLVVTDDPETVNIIGALDHVSGSSLRGALAYAALRAGWKDTGEPFRQVFAHEHVRFGPLYPCGGDESNPFRFAASVPFPTPLSVLTCKYSPGVVNRDHRRGVHGIRNVLLDNPLQECGQCEAPLVPLEHHVQLVDRQDAAKCCIEHVQSRRRTSQRTQIDETTLSSRTGRLYSTEAIPAGTWLAGYVWGPPELLQEVLALWKGHPTIRLRVGKALTRGHGAIDLQWINPCDLSSERSPHADYPMLLAEQTAEPAAEADPPTPPAKTPGSLYLYSDLIAVDALLRPITRLDGRLLWQLIGGEDAVPFQITAGYCATRRIGGFNGQANLPRWPDVALVAGSTWKLTWTAAATPDVRVRALKRLQQAMRDGLGLRRGEGFGRVIVDLPLTLLDEDQTPAGTALLPLNNHLASPRVNIKPDAQSKPHREAPQKTVSAREIAKRLTSTRIGFARLLSICAQTETPAESLLGALLGRLRWSGQRGHSVWTEDDRNALSVKIQSPHHQDFADERQRCDDEENVLLDLALRYFEDAAKTGRKFEQTTAAFRQHLLVIADQLVAIADKDESQ